MIETPDIQRPPRELIEGLAEVGSATTAGELRRLGIRDPHILGPVSWNPGKSIVGPALTLQFMPRREDLHPEGEYAGPERQLHRQVLYHTQPGDVVVVDARGDMSSGVFGEMMLTYFKGQGGAGSSLTAASATPRTLKNWTSVCGCAASPPTSMCRPTSFRMPSMCPSPAVAFW